MTFEERRVVERRGPGRRLTDRQAAIIDLVAQGLSNKAIASRLGITEQAVKEHVSKLLERLAVPNRAALAEAATTLRIVGTTDLAPASLDLLFQRSPVMTAVLEGPSHVFVTANEAFRAATGSRELEGRPLADVFPELERGRVAMTLDTVYRERAPKVLNDVAARWYRRGAELEDGYVTVLLQPVEAEGRVAGIVVFVVDVTEQVAALRQLNDLTPEQLAILDLLPQGVIVVDASGNTLKLNAEGQRLLRRSELRPLSEENAVGYAVTDAATGEKLSFAQLPLVRALREGKPVAARDLHVRSTAGTDVRIHAAASPVFDRDGHMRGAVAIFSEF